MTDDVKALRDALAAGPTRMREATDALHAVCTPHRIARLLDALEAAQKDAARFHALRDARKSIKLYVYDDPEDPFSGDWQYNPQPQDVDAFADGLIADAAMKGTE